MIEHGHYTISVQGNMIVSKFFGAWNLEQAQAYADHVQKISTSLLAKPWARVVDLSEWEGGGHEVVEPLKVLHLWAAQHHCEMVVFVKPALLPQFMLDKFGALYGNYNVFDSVEQATEWVASELTNLSATK